MPAEPVRRALRDWLKERDLAEYGGHNRDNYHSPLEILCTRTGMAKDTIYRHSKGDRQFESMQFDVADTLLCATERFHWWWTDPQLSEAYERACQGADRIYPIAEPEPAQPVFSVCEKCSQPFELTSRHGSPRRYCSHACRQAAYKERKVAA